MSDERTPPWSFIEVDRGFTTMCWVVERAKGMESWFTQVIGERSPGELFQHLCEKYGEQNHCARPSHVIIGTKSSNTKHWHDLRAAAGVPWAGGRRVGDTMSEEAKAKISAKLRGRVYSAESRAKMSAGQRRRSPCPVCGRLLTPTWLTRHQCQ